MNQLMDKAITEAKAEWAEDGVLSLTTVSRLNELGVDVYSLELELEQELL